VTSFELDMGIDAEDLVAGFERLFERLRLPYRRLAAGAAPGVEFAVQQGGAETRISIEPMPAARWVPGTFPPRALVSVHSAAPAAEVERLRREILLAFLRVTG
jgi:hypothetical protein